MVGTEALAAADLGHAACDIKPSWRKVLLAPPQSHRADNPQTTGQLYQKNSRTVKFQNEQQISQSGNLAKGLRTPREFDFGGQWDLITEVTQAWENRLMDTHKQVWFSLLWGHCCSFLLAPQVHKVLSVSSKSLFPQSCASSVIKSHWPPKSNFLGILWYNFSPDCGTTASLMLKPLTV